MDFHDLVLFNGQMYPGRPAIVTMDRVITYGMLRQGILSVAQVLRQRGLRRGSVVGIAVERQSWHVIAALAVAEIGGIAMALPGRGLVARLRLAIDALVTDSTAPAAPPGTAPVLTMTDRWFELPPTRLPGHGYSGPDSIARVMFSSGATGAPKAMALTNGDVHERMLVSNLRDSHFGWERLLSLLPPHAAFGFSRALCCLSTARTLHLADDVEDAARMLSLFSIEFFCASNAQAAGVMDALAGAPTPLPALRLVMVGGSLYTPSFMARLRKAFPSEIWFQYGSSEASAIACVTSSRVPDETGVAGFVAPWADVQIVDDSGAAVPAGTEGRIRVRRTNSARPWPSGSSGPDTDPGGQWHEPGDTGMLREDGLLMITGRTDDLINVGGVKIAPERLDETMAGAPGVQSAAAVGVSAPGGGTEVWVGVVSATPIDATQLGQWLKGKVAGLGTVRVFQIASIPRATSDKIDRAGLRAQLSVAMSAAGGSLELN